MNNSESGNVIFYVLVAVALLAALSYAVSQGSRGGAEQISEERARLYASEIIEFTNVLSSAVAQTRLRGYSDTQISFENDQVAGFTNANCTEDICKIFHPSGGGVSYVAPQLAWIDSTHSAGASYGEWIFSGHNTIFDVGTDCAVAPCTENKELTVILPYLNSSICTTLNDLLDVTNPSGNPPVEGSGISTGKFVGVYSASAGGVDATTELEGKRSSCFQVTTNPSANAYVFIHTLIAR